MTIREMMAMYHSLQFVEELLDYIEQYPDDDYMTMECLCRKLVKYKLMRKVDGYYIADRKTENSSEKPNNCKHITEDGVTCARYPACDDCPDNPLNKVKGSERLLKGKAEPTMPTISKMEQVEPQLTPNYCGTCKYREVPCGDLPCDVCHGYSNYEPKDEPTISKMEQVDKDINVRSKDEPQEVCDRPQKDCENCWKELHCRAKDEP